MKRFIFPAIIILLGVVIAFLHSLALENFLYWAYRWFDILMHFLGGLLISLFVLYLYTRYRKTSFLNETNHRVLLNIFLFALIVGLVWESFELVYELTLSDKVLYIKDTLMDFTMNTVGAIVGYIFVKKSPYLYE